MYGGVSLAMYENGVAQELFRATKGEPGGKPGPYDLIKALIDSDIVVDVLSGASAGGINGIFLGYALANGKDFRVVAIFGGTRRTFFRWYERPTIRPTRR
jgi:predicted acylesterase/phospholipase RssA